MIDETLTPETFEDLASVEELAVALERHPDYRVLRRFVPDRERVYDFSPAGGTVRDIHEGVYVDFEMTGLDPLADKPIELAMARFAYDSRGVVTWVGDTYEALENPGRPIPPEISELTGITDADVVNQAFDDDHVRAILDGAAIVIAHNADFDRKVAEARFPALAFKRLPWGCSYRDIPWRERYGVRNAQLPTLLQETRGQFYDAHRAMDDVLVGIHVLAGRVPKVDEASFLAELLGNAMTPTLRLLAWGSPFSQKDVLKARGYRWEATKKVWYRDLVLGSPGADDERSWLGKVCPGSSTVTFTATDRYSIRV